MKHTYQILWTPEGNERGMKTTSGLQQEGNFPKCEDSLPEGGLWLARRGWGLGGLSCPQDYRNASLRAVRGWCRAGEHTGSPFPLRGTPGPGREPMLRGVGGGWGGSICHLPESFDLKGLALNSIWKHPKGNKHPSAKEIMDFMRGVGDQEVEPKFQTPSSPPPAHFSWFTPNKLQ